MNEKIAKFFKAKPVEVKPQVLSVVGLQAKAAALYKEVEDRIAEDSKDLDALGEDRQRELIAHENAIKNLMTRHENIMNGISVAEARVRDSIHAAQIMKSNLAKIA
ncbi:hypothetical protein UGMREWDR_CDS0049 [Aeromonas phage GomatiRiver_11]|nr:hypothetical protein OBDJBBDK_00045 [Aeromonas phage AhFM11]WKW84216.1 hypothetical protein UGMREWDR_CDS0049 [Aeromonas phage GomatiRiver_11]